MGKYKFDWNEGNTHKSVTKHKIENSEAESSFYDKNRKIVKSYSKYAEKRYICIGLSNTNKLLSNVFCIREKSIRIISSRKANKKEEKIYFEK